MKNWLNKNSNKTGFLFFGLVVILLCFGYHRDNRNLTINNLASDNWSIIPMLQKMQDTTLFPADQFLSDASVFKNFYPSHFYLTTFFASLCKGDILKGYALYSEATLVLYLMTWFALIFFFTRNAWISTLIAILAKGILWPPGKEIWGAGELMFFLPRTVFTALIPIALILIMHGIFKNKKAYLYAGFLLAGVFGNLHPISGLGIGMALLLALLLYSIFLLKDSFGRKITTLLISGTSFLIGLSPYFVPYVLRAADNTRQAYDKVQFKQLISERISSEFTNPFNIYGRYMAPQWLALIGGSLLLSVIAFMTTKNMRRQISFVWFFSAATLINPLLFSGLEKLLNNMGFNQINISYELVRTSKYIIIGCYLMLGLGLVGVFGAKRLSKPLPGFIMVVGFLGVCLLAKGPLKNKPVFKFDFFRAQLPQSITGMEYLPYEYANLDSALDWIKINTPKSATFAGPPQIRGGALRSIPFDYKGASVLLEANKPKYVEWALNNIKFEDLKGDSEKIAFYKNLKIEYLLDSSIHSDGDTLLHTFGPYRLYKLAY